MGRKLFPGAAWWHVQFPCCSEMPPRDCNEPLNRKTDWTHSIQTLRWMQDSLFILTTRHKETSVLVQRIAGSYLLIVDTPVLATAKLVTISNLENSEQPMRTSFTRKFSVTALALGSKITEKTTTMMTPISSMTPTNMAPDREMKLQCSDGMVLAAQQWTSKASPLDDREGETRVSANDTTFKTCLMLNTEVWWSDRFIRTRNAGATGGVYTQ